MTIHRVLVRDFQSLAQADLELGRFSVIVGPSSSGKSAFVRALKTVAGNARGSSFVRHGARGCSVGIDTDRGDVVWARAGDAVSYRVGDNHYTKMAGTVPAQITETLGIQDLSLHVAGQFDRPYLLDASSAEVARTLGALTNVDTILEAAREAARRTRETSGVLKTRKTDLARLQEELKEFVGFKDRLKAQDEAESALRSAQGAQTQLSRIQGLRRALEVAESQLRSASSTVVEPPDLSLGVELRAQSLRLVELYKALKLTRQQVHLAEAKRVALDEEVTKLEQDRLDLLHDLGTCPVCGNEIKETH